MVCYFPSFVAPGLGGPDDVVLGEDRDLRVVVLAYARILVHAQVHVHLRHARSHLIGRVGVRRGQRG